MTALIKEDIETIPLMEEGSEDTPTILVEVFGDSPQIRVLDFFMDFPMNDYMQREIAEKTGMNPRTVKKVLTNLLENGTIRVNRKIAKSALYKLNSKSRLVHKLKEFELEVSLQSIE